MADPDLPGDRPAPIVPIGGYRTFGRSGHIKSQRSCSWDASRFALSISRHFIMLPFRPYFFDQLVNVKRPLRSHLVHSTRSTSFVGEHGRCPAAEKPRRGQPPGLSRVADQWSG